jgi:indolepyruvate ferredoxin oxidoreductase, alpha subunit
MAAVLPITAPGRVLISGNAAVARGAWEAGVLVATAYPGEPATEILERLAGFPELHAEWSVNEKVALEVATGAAYAGSRALCAMKHVGLNVASDALMTLTLTGVAGGLLIVVADDVGLASSQNEQDSRFWGRFAHLPVLEPADPQEAWAMSQEGFALSEEFGCPVILRLTSRVCRVKGLVTQGERVAHPASGFVKDAARWVMTPANAAGRIPLMFARERELSNYSDQTPLNVLERGKGSAASRRVGFIASGPAYLHVRESFPDAPVLKMGLSYPLPMKKIRGLIEMCDAVVVVEEVEPLVETEIKAEGFKVHGKDILPRIGELSPEVLKPAIARLLGEGVGEPTPAAALRAPLKVFPRPPTMCVGCPHLGVYYTLSQLKNIIIAGDLGCYSLGAGQPWNALDTCIAMGASLGVALGLDKGRSEADRDQGVLAVIGDSTFLHMGMQGLLDIVYQRGNVTVLLLDNRTVGMTGGQNNPGSGRDIRDQPAPQVDFAKLVEALGVRPERIRKVDPYVLPTLFKTLREEIRINEPSVILTDRPCVLIDDFAAQQPYTVLEERCTGCGSCLEVGCPAIHVTRRDSVRKPSGQEVERSFVRIESAACTGCGLCLQPCAPDAIRHPRSPLPIRVVTLPTALP